MKRNRKMTPNDLKMLGESIEYYDRFTKKLDAEGLKGHEGYSWIQAKTLAMNEMWADRHDILRLLKIGMETERRSNDTDLFGAETANNLNTGGKNE